MRKLYTSLFLAFIFIFPSFAAEEISKPIITIKTEASQMMDILGILKLHSVNLSETVFYSDYDETLATTVGVYKGQEYKFLSCPDRKRTYKLVFSEAFQKFASSQGFGASQGFEASQGFTTSQKITSSQGFTASQNFPSSQGLNASQLFNASQGFLLSQEFSASQEFTTSQVSSYDLDTFDFLELPVGRFDDPPVERYEVLDAGATNLIATLCEEALFVGVCSAQPEDNLKKDLMKYVGLSTKNYIFADREVYGDKVKPRAICEHLEKIKNPHKKITTIVILDNSEGSVIDPFLRDMPGLVEELASRDVNIFGSEVNIIGIVFTKFAKIATPEVILEELYRLKAAQQG